MKVLICSVYAAGGDDPFLSLLPVGVGSLVAVLRRSGVQAKAANLIGLTPAAIREVLIKERPAILGISVMTHNRHESLRLAELAKTLNPDCFVVFGGPHATHRYRQILESYSAVDTVVLGEGEETLRELAVCLDRGVRGDFHGINGIAFRDGDRVVVTGPRSPVTDLDLLPPPREGFVGGINIDLRRQVEFLITSRGCPAACTFCSSPNFWGRSLRFHSPRAMVDEIRTIRDRYGLIYFSIRDDTFTADRKRVMEFCRLLLEDRLFILWNCQSRVTAVDEEMLLWMRRAGCECIQYGVESGSPTLLAILGKRITPGQIIQAAEITRKIGIRLSVYLMTGVPGETELELKETLRLLEAVKADDGQVSPLAYYPGTALHVEAVRRGELREDLFEQSEEEALYARHDPFVESATKKMLGKIQSVAKKEVSRRRGATSRSVSTYCCHADTITAGELMADEGDLSGAEALYREIVRREPDNPWGWLLLGELLQEMGRRGEAVSAYRQLAELLPSHVPVWEALANLYGRSGERTEARRCREQARRLLIDDF